jgi:hypothetical protein
MARRSSPNGEDILMANSNRSGEINLHPLNSRSHRDQEGHGPIPILRFVLSGKCLVLMRLPGAKAIMNPNMITMSITNLFTSVEEQERRFCLIARFPNSVSLRALWKLGTRKHVAVGAEATVRTKSIALATSSRESNVNVIFTS